MQKGSTKSDGLKRDVHITLPRFFFRFKGNEEIKKNVIFFNRKKQSMLKYRMNPDECKSIPRDTNRYVDESDGDSISVNMSSMVMDDTDSPPP